MQISDRSLMTSRIRPSRAITLRSVSIQKRASGAQDLGAIQAWITQHSPQNMCSSLMETVPPSFATNRTVFIPKSTVADDQGSTVRFQTN